MIGLGRSRFAPLAALPSILHDASSISCCSRTSRKMQADTVSEQSSTATAERMEGFLGCDMWAWLLITREVFIRGHVHVNF